MPNRISILFLGMALLASCALEQVSPADYNDAIFVQQMKVKNLITDLTKAPDDDVRKQIIEELRMQADNSLAKINEIGPFRGDDQLLLAAQPLFEYYVEFSQNMLNAPVEQIPILLDMGLEKQIEFEQKFLKAQGVFAEKYGLFM